MNQIVRKGTPADLPRLLELIVELAVYEKEPNAVEVTIDELEKDGFGENSIFDFFVAEIDGVIQGIALYYFKYSTWKGKCLFLEDIVVNEKFRGKGIGKVLFDQVVNVAAEHHCKRMEWQVLKWNTPAIEFYKNKFDAQLDAEWLNGRLVYDQLQKLKS
ncbi:GNAT family N-acetyltransferase [bacterium SCSIO 12643]|nr:GNAT family N-acetyltransferase [bacterium SCSIO 12643]